MSTCDNKTGLEWNYSDKGILSSNHTHIAF